MIELKNESRLVRIALKRDTDHRIPLEKIPVKRSIVLDFQDEQSEFTMLCRPDDSVMISVSRDCDGKLRETIYEIFQGYILVKYPMRTSPIDKDDEDYGIIDSEMKGVGI